MSKKNWFNIVLRAVGFISLFVVFWLIIVTIVDSCKDPVEVVTEKDTGKVCIDITDDASMPDGGFDVFAKVDYGDLCKPCKRDDQCTQKGSECVRNINLLDYYCSIDCSNRECPINFICSSKTHFDGTHSKHCITEDAHVTCKEAFENIGRAELCKPCVESSQCDDANSECILNTRILNFFCSIDCSDSECPPGFYCSNKIEGIDMTQCIPRLVSMTCEEALKKGEAK